MYKIQRKGSIELSIKDINFSGEQNSQFREVKAVIYSDLENTFKNSNYSPIQWKGNNRHQDNFISASGFVIDIDNGMTIQEAEAVLTKHNLNYALITSKSHSDALHKFHILLPFNRVVYTAENYKAIARQIKADLFPALDVNTMDAARFMFGSPIGATYSDNFAGVDYQVDSSPIVSDAWNEDFKVKLANRRVIVAVDQPIDKGKTVPIFCPFHVDSNASAFIAYSEDSFNHYIRCSACGKTYWKVQTKDVISLKTERFWSYGTSVYEAGLTGDVFSLENISEKKYYIKVGAVTKDQRDEYFTYIVKNKHLHHLNRIDSIGDVNADKSTFDINVADGNITVRVRALPVKLKDNTFIENYINSVFGQYAKFIKEWLAIFVYSNYKKLPTIILTGDRGVGKNTFAESVGAIFPVLSETAKDLDGNFNPFAEKKLLIIDEAASNGKVQYQMLKKFSGQKTLEVNKKYMPQYQVLNNLNIIFLSNDELPIYVERDEIPTDDRNNQFFVFRMKPHGVFDADLQQKLIDRIGYYIRTELKTVFNSLNTSGYRYSIAVPITDDEKKLFNNSVTDIEAEADRVIDYVESHINDNFWSCYDFAQAGYLPTSLLTDCISSNRVNKTKVIQNLQKHGYIANEKAGKYIQLRGQRPYCYKLGPVWLGMVNQVPAQTTPNAQLSLLTGTD